MPGNEISSSDREKSPCLMRSNNDQRRRSKEVSPKVGEPLKKYPKRKRPKSCSKSSNDRRTDKQRSPSPKRRSKKSKKRHRSRSKKCKKKKHRRYSSSHHHQAHLITILMEVIIEIMRARKAQILDSKWFLRRISTNTAYSQIWHNTLTLILYLYQGGRPNKSCPY